MTPAAGPDAFSWAAATVRGLHPLRWGLALVGLAATVTVAAGLQAFWERQAPQLGDWFGDPVGQAHGLWDHLAGRSFAGLVVRLGVLLVVVAAVWAVVGAWIARHELVARRRGQPYATAEPVEPGPTGLVARQLKSLTSSCLLILAICAVLWIPLLLAGALNHLGGIGAILVAIVLPVVLVADLILLAIAIGLLAWPLMPVTLAAENSDTFDALSRAYNYAYQRPVRFALLTAATLVLAAIPLAATLYLLAGPVENWPAACGRPAVWAAAGLSASVFWSAQTLAYLSLRKSVDGTGVNEIAREAAPEIVPSETPAVEERPPDAAPKPAASGPGLVAHVLILGFMVATWAVTAWVFARIGGENAGWLGWGLGGHFRPPAQGLYGVASVLAGVWGFLWVTAPILVMLRGAFRRRTEAAGEAPPEPAGGTGSAEPLLK